MKILILLTFLATTSGAMAQGIFAIKPYLILGEDNSIGLHFQMSQDISLSINVSGKSEKSTRKFFNRYKENVLNKISLGPLSCKTVLNYKFINDQNQTEIEQGTFPIPCSEAKPLYIGFMSDTQIKNQEGQVRAGALSKVVTDLKNKYPFSLLINAGDIVQIGGREKEWLNFFQTSENYLKSSYLISAIGNHEYFESEHMDKATPEFLKYMRDDHAHELGRLTIDLGPATLLVLNSNFKFMSEAKIKEQWDWLEEKIKINQTIKKPVFISFHHSPFSSSMEWVRDIPTRLRNEFVPLIEKYSCVKIVLTGHLHMFERSFKAGIHYLIAGPSGGILNPITYRNPYKIVAKPFLTTFSLFEIRNKEAKVKTFDSERRLVDEFEFSLKLD